MQWADARPSGSSGWGLKGHLKAQLYLLDKGQTWTAKHLHLLRLWKELYKCQWIQAVFSVLIFSWYLGNTPTRGGSRGEQNQDLGFIKKAMTSKDQSDLVWSGSVWIWGQVCDWVAPAAESTMEFLGGTCGSQECSITPWHGLGSKQATDFTNGSDSMKKRFTRGWKHPDLKIQMQK